MDNFIQLDLKNTIPFIQTHSKIKGGEDIFLIIFLSVPLFLLYKVSHGWIRLNTKILHVLGPVL